MVTKTVKVVNKRGLHARPGSDFVNAAKNFTSKITIKRLDEDDDPVNAKSIAFVLSLGVSCGVEIELSASGEDEQQAIDTLVAMINEGFGDM